MNAREFIAKLPVPICGLSLGLASLDLFLTQRYDLYLYSIFAALSAVIVILFTLRIIFDHRGILKDIENPAVFGVLPTYTMTIMLLSTYAKDYIGEAATVIWLGAVAASFVLIFFFIKKFIIKFEMGKVFPSWMIIFVGYVVASVTSPVFGMEELGKILFWSGFFCYLVLLPLIAYRTLKVRNIPEALIPQITIIAAPANLCIVGSLSAFGGAPPDAVLLILAALGVAVYVAIMAYLPVMLRIKFYPSYAAFTFPLVISTVSFYNLGVHYGLLSNDIFVILWAITLIAAILIVLYVLIRYVVYFRNITISAQ